MSAGHLSSQRLLAALLLTLLFAGCSHPVKISPQLAMARADARLIDARVGYHITDVQRALQTTSDGGGGDKISYYPYRDLEPAFYETLSSVFAAVFVVPDTGSREFIADKQLRFVFKPEFETSSSSSNVIFWNPTDFVIRLTATAFDAAGQQVWTRLISASGKAPAGGSIVETPSAQAAANQLFVDLQSQLLNSPELRK